MHQQTLTHSAARGWSAPLPANLDSPQTLLLVFAAPELEADPEPLWPPGVRLAYHAARALPAAWLLWVSYRELGRPAGEERPEP
jgi:hypothetical protein